MKTKLIIIFALLLTMLPLASADYWHDHHTLSRVSSLYHHSSSYDRSSYDTYSSFYHSSSFHSRYSYDSSSYTHHSSLPRFAPRYRCSY